MKTHLCGYTIRHSLAAPKLREGGSFDIRISSRSSLA
jgi:hypothetical protein